MTANSDLKKLIRNRMHRTGQSYAAARRSFLHSKEADMTKQNSTPEASLLRQPIDRLELTLRTARVLRQHEITMIGQLAGKSERELADIGVSAQGRIEIREVLASRGI